MQVCAFSLKPGDFLIPSLQSRRVGGNLSNWRRGVWSIPGKLASGNDCSCQVVVQKPHDGSVACSRLLNRCSGMSVSAHQIVEPITAESGLVDKMIIVQIIEKLTGRKQISAVEGRCRVVIDISTE